MTAVLRPVVALLVSVAILLMGNGLFGILIPVRAQIEAFSEIQIGGIGAAYYAGLALGCFFAPNLIARVGHIRAFIALTAVATIMPLLAALWIAPSSWFFVRTLTGFCFAGLFMVIESWLAGASSHEIRGRVLGVYNLLNLAMLTAGMQLIAVAPAASHKLFLLVAILFSLAALPLALTTAPQPVKPRSATFRFAALYAISPLALVGCLLTGMANGAFWSLTPIYGQAAGLSSRDLALLLTIPVLVGAACQWPIGHLSDRFGRRAALIAAASTSALAGLGLFGVVEGTPLVIFAFAALYGAFAFSIYPICVAHANDLVAKEEAINASSGLLLTFSVGGVLGPLLAAAAMEFAGPGALFLLTALVHVVTAFLVVFRIVLRPELPAGHKEPFIAVPRTTQAVFELDPRAEDDRKEMASAPAGDRGA